MQANLFTESLQCLLTQDEKLIRGEELAQLLLTTHKLELEKKTFCDDIKSKLAEAEERAQDVGRQLREGKEWRDIECKEVPDFEHGQVDTVRTDINEVIRSRRMRPEERQETIVYPDGTSCSPPKTPRSRRLEQTNKDDDEDDADDDLFRGGLQ
jgi:uncharacterized protein (UPF0335 family)